jgi:hypothetical protein
VLLKVRTEVKGKERGMLGQTISDASIFSEACPTRNTKRNLHWQKDPDGNLHLYRRKSAGNVLLYRKIEKIPSSHVSSP